MDVTALNKRRNNILDDLISLHVESAKPVSSKLIKQKYNLSISSATIRNIMSELEDLGYINQPHTSSGRIPTDKGYRFYIDSLMREEILKPEEKQNVRKNYKLFLRHIEDVIDKTSEFLSTMSYEAGINLFFDFKESLLKCIDLVGVSQDKVLMTMVTDSGIVKNYLLALDEAVSLDELHRISNFLNVNFQDMSLAGIKSKLVDFLEEDETSISQLAQKALKIFDTLDSDNIFEDEYEIHQDGTSYILKKPEFKDIDKLRNVLDFLEDKSMMAEILKSNLDTSLKEVKISIGNENKFKGIKECSLITSKYSVGDRVVGVLGLLGPTRMDYARIIPLVKYVSGVLSEILTAGALSDEEEDNYDET